MKKILVLFLLLSQFIHSQPRKLFGREPIINMENWDKQRVYWGFYLGLNSYDFKIDYKLPGKEVVVNSKTSFDVGLIGNLRLMEHLDLRFEPGLYYAQRNLTFPGLTAQKDYLREVKSTYIHLPLLLKFSSKRIGNARPFLVGGVSRTLNLASNSDAKEDNYERRFRVQKWTQNWEAGFGIDIYTEYFVFSPSIRGVFSFKDELIRDNNPDSPWTGNIDAMKTRAVFINFSFH